MKIIIIILLSMTLISCNRKTDKKNVEIQLSEENSPFKSVLRMKSLK